MGNLPQFCCSQNISIEHDCPVDTNKNRKYLTQPNYSLLIYLQIRIKKFLKSSKISESKYTINHLYGEEHTFKREKTAKFFTFHRKSTEIEFDTNEDYKSNIKILFLKNFNMLDENFNKKTFCKIYR